MDPNESPAAASTPSLAGTLRKLIADGHYAAGSRLGEEAVAQALGVSRTPVRLAFRTLAQEGLLQPAGKRGFVVREFSAEDVRCAVEVRGALEGLAARRMAERGATAAERDTLLACIHEGEAVLAVGTLGAEGIEAWGRINARFHACIVASGGSRVIGDAIARNNHLPFASADSITVEAGAMAREHDKLRFAQLQHRLVVEALLQRESARVETLMREHALIGVRYAALFGLSPVLPAG
jgi:GntR family transcriptional regulator, vanillate catabolism transcriptional regulator